MSDQAPGVSHPNGEPSVTLRRVSPVDAETIFAWRSEPSARRYQPLRQIPVDGVHELLIHRSRQPVDPSFDSEAQWVIQAAGTPVGWVTLEVISREHRIGSVGYTVAERFQGRGYASAGLKALLAIALSPEAPTSGGSKPSRPSPTAPRARCWRRPAFKKRESRGSTWRLTAPASTTSG